MGSWYCTWETVQNEQFEALAKWFEGFNHQFAPKDTLNNQQHLWNMHKQTQTLQITMPALQPSKRGTTPTYKLHGYLITKQTHHTMMASKVAELVRNAN